MSSQDANLFAAEAAAEFLVASGGGGAAAAAAAVASSQESYAEIAKRIKAEGLDSSDEEGDKRVDAGGAGGRDHRDRHHRNGSGDNGGFSVDQLVVTTAKVKTVHELCEGGENRRFNDEMEYILDGLASSSSNRSSDTGDYDASSSSAAAATAQHQAGSANRLNVRRTR